MLSDEEKEIFNNLKEYMQSKIDNGYHKFIYNDLDWDFKCIDCINAIDNALKQSKEIEELKEKRFTLFDTTIKATIKINDKKWEDKIKATIEELEKQDRENRMSYNYLVIPVLQSLLEKE